jgi:hypothetical protein
VLFCSCVVCGALQIDDGTTSLCVACDKGHHEVVRLLLDRGAVVNQARVGFVCVYTVVRPVAVGLVSEAWCVCGVFVDAVESCIAFVCV